MSTKSQNERIILGLKVKQLRQGKKLSFAKLAQATGMSVSYLNEIEKGKKFPKEEKLHLLAKALGTKYSALISPQLQHGLSPVSDLLKSNFLNELPLDLFGIDLNKVVEIIANAPDRVGAFISTLLEISRNYALREENFYFGALRSYLEMNDNYFQEIEDAIEAFSRENKLSAKRPLSASALKALLEEKYEYTIIDNGLDAYPELKSLRSVFIPGKKQLLLNSRLSNQQLVFQCGKELGFQYLGLEERAYTSSILRGRVFEEVLNHSKAIYFSAGLLIPLSSFRQDMQGFFAQPKWDGEAFLNIMRRYDVTPETFYHRLTNVLPRFFGLRDLFFLRFLHEPENDGFEMDRELHLNRRHPPHGNQLLEHYCRRWVAISLLKDLHHLQREGKFVETIVRAQRSRFVGGDDEYLCITLARPGYPSPHKNVSVTLGLRLDEHSRKVVGFLNDPSIQHKEVNKTCERCAIEDCRERAAPPVIVQKREENKRIQECLEGLFR